MTMHPSADLIRKAGSFAAICICSPTRLLHGCPRHAPSDAGTPESHHHMLIRLLEQQAEILENQETIMTALTDLQAADAALKTEVSTFLANVATALTNAGAASDPAIEQVVADINAEVAALQAADPVTGTSATPPATGTAGSTAPAAPAAPASGDAGTTASAG